MMDHFDIVDEFHPDYFEYVVLDLKARAIICLQLDSIGGDSRYALFVDAIDQMQIN